MTRDGLYSLVLSEILTQRVYKTEAVNHEGYVHETRMTSRNEKCSDSITNMTYTGLNGEVSVRTEFNPEKLTRL
jgi:hypothetical protein